MKTVVHYLDESTPNPFAGRKIAPILVFWISLILRRFMRSTVTNLLHFRTIYRILLGV